MGRPPIDRRQVVNGIVWILRTGAPRRDLSEESGKWSTVRDLFDAWSSDGLLDAILQRLRGSCVDAGLIDQEIWHIDGTIVRAVDVLAAVEKKRIRGNRQTIPSAVPAAAFPPKSISFATMKGTRSASR